MTEKHIFVYKLFLSLNISDFSLFLGNNCNPLKKVTPLFPSNPHRKIKILSSSPFLEIWSEAQTTQQKGRGEGAHWLVSKELELNKETKGKHE